MITSVSDLLPFVLQEVPGATSNFVRFHIQMAARRFFDRTETWRKTLADISLVADQAAYPLDPAVTTDVEPEIRRLVWAKRDGALLDHSTYDLFPTDSTPAYALTFKDDYIPSVASTDALSVRVVLVPQPQTDIIPPNILTKYLEGIRTEALHALFSIPGNRWSSEYAAERYRRLAAREVNAAIREINVDSKELVVQSSTREWL